MSLRTLALVSTLTMIPLALAAVAPGTAIAPDVVRSTAARLIATHGTGQAGRIHKGVQQVADRWWVQDGNSEAFATFCEANFLADETKLKEAFERLERVMEQVDGHLHEIRRELTTPLDLDTGPLSALDQLLSNVDFEAHVDEDLFANKVAFLALLNFPVNTLAERLEMGPSWDRETWARSRMMDRFNQRIPAPVLQEITRAFTAAEQYIAGYNIRLDRVISPDGQRPFGDREPLRLNSHWGLRDELKSHYAEGAAGLAKMRMIQKVMERIVRQEIPSAVIDNADLLWCPETNAVKPAAERKAPTGAPLDAKENDVRYAKLLGVFHAVRKADPYSPTAPTFMDRRFNLDRQIPEKEAETLLVSVLQSSEVRDLAQVIEGRLGRPLEPFDIWYSGFMSRGSRSEQALDEIVKRKYPTVQAYQADIPRLLHALGFATEKARWISDHIVVDPSRGSGHAMGAVRREDKAHLRTRIPEGGMNYKGYNIAIHEMGHNVEQVFSLNSVDHWWLTGVPNNAFTEALAFVFQGRDLALLDTTRSDDEDLGAETLNDLWSAMEIAGVGLVDMRVWRWMYAHPEAKPAELREATLAIARDIWNRHYAPIFGKKDVEILAIYSHMISNGLYLPDYPIGHIIAFQVARKLRSGDFGVDFERIARQGRLTPDAWMRGAVGGPLSADSLL